jgi:hypothetical protein
MKLYLSKRKTNFFPLKRIIEDYIQAVNFLKYQRFSEKQTSNNLKNLIRTKYSEKKTNQVFKYNSLIDFDCSLDKMLLFYGKPIIRSTSKENTNVETLIYKNKLRGIKVKCSLTFHKEKLLVYSYVIEQPSKKEFQKLRYYASSKYGFNRYSLEEKIIDKNENFLILKQSSDEVSFNFFANNIYDTKIFETYNTEENFVNTSQLAFNNLL